jgi:bacillithiol synthase
LTTECYPISILPHASRIFLDYVERREPLAPFYANSPYSNDWIKRPPVLEAAKRAAIADLLESQNRSFGAGDAVLANIARLRAGAAAVVTGQQVALFGGPLFTLLKAATAIRKAQDASAAGHPHVPIFWLATEDHDLAEANHVALPSRHELHTLKLDAPHHAGEPVGGVRLGANVSAMLEQAANLLGPGPLLDDLERFYTSEATFGESFARLLSSVFSAHGLIIIDASSRAFHALGADVLRRAITQGRELNDALLERDRELAAAGYHSQVLVSPQSSLLFLLDAESGTRQSLKRTAEGEWQAGKKHFTESELLSILDTAPERLSPNALLRPVYQDAILPTCAYIGGPAEIAYFAQTQVLYAELLGRTTPILPRLSATLIEPAIAEVMASHEISLADILSLSPEELAQRLGARSMPAEGKRSLAAAGNALETELETLTGWMRSLDESLGRSADVAASKMRYQMNRLRRLSANFQLQRDDSLQRHVDALYLSLFPNRHPQERLLGAAWFLSRYGESLPPLLIEHAAQECPGHKAIYL